MKSLFCLMFLVSCAQMQALKDYTLTEEYQKKEKLDGHFLKPEGQSLSEGEVQKLLSGKIVYQEKMKLVLAFEDEVPLFKVTSAKEKVWKELLSKNKKIADIQVMPSILKSKESTLDSLRTMAILMQADLLLILKSRHQSDFKHTFLSHGEAKTVLTVEAIAVDTRTGAIPYSTISSQTLTLEKEEQDFRLRDVIERSRLAAYDLAFTEIMESVSNYFNN